MMYDVVIIGGGIAGLTSAFYLKDKNILILEKRSRMGGKIYSEKYKGVYYTKGAEYIGKPFGALKEIIESLKLQLKEIPYPMDAKFYQNKFYYGEKEIIKMFIEHSSFDMFKGFMENIKEAFSEYSDIPYFDFNSSIERLDYITAKEWFEEMGLNEVYFDSYNVTSRGLFGANIDEISALSFVPEIAFDYVTINKINDLEKKYEIGEYPTDAYTFENGLFEMIEALYEHMKDVVRLNSDVIKIKKKAGYYRIFLREKQDTKFVDTKSVILATPSPITLEIADEVLSQEKKALLNQIHYSTYITVSLITKKPIFDEAFDLAVSDDFFFTDIYDSFWVKRFYNQDFHPEFYITGVYIAGKSYKDKYLITLSDSQILKNVIKDIERIFGDIKDIIVDYDICRFIYAYPVMRVGSYSKLMRLNELNTGTLILAGDYMIYPTLESAAESGKIAAMKIKKYI